MLPKHAAATMGRMKRTLATLVAAAALAGCAAPYAPQDYDFSDLTSPEMIESLRARELRALEDAFVHEINPESEFRL
jgi:hypothetical protein